MQTQPPAPSSRSTVQTASQQTSPEETKIPLDGVDVLLTDLDGVVYRGKDPIPYAVEALSAAASSARVGYITNNASRLPEQVAAHLSEYGLPVGAQDVVTSSQAGTRLLRDLVPVA